jgi:20S proteasome subunit beta 3
VDWCLGFDCLGFDCRFGPYYVEPLIAGLEEDGTPFIASTDLIGCPLVCTDFVVGGTCTEQLYGMCEALHNPDMGPDELFEAISQALLNAQDRDALSGWGGVVHIM